ncbi:unnamed protein product, partial [marine sediment metagenome]
QIIGRTAETVLLSFITKEAQNNNAKVLIGRYQG